MNSTKTEWQKQRAKEHRDKYRRKKRLEARLSAPRTTGQMREDQELDRKAAEMLARMDGGCYVE